MTRGSAGQGDQGSWGKLEGIGVEVVLEKLRYGGGGGSGRQDVDDKFKHNMGEI